MSELEDLDKQVFLNRQDRSKKMLRPSRRTIRAVDALIDQRTARGPQLGGLADSLLEPKADQARALWGSDPIDPQWFLKLTSSGPSVSNAEALIRGHAMASYLEHAGGRLALDRPLNDPDSAATAGTTARTRIHQTLESLFAIAILPAAEDGEVARYLISTAPIEIVGPLLERHIFSSALGWRCVRVLTLLLERAAKLEVLGTDPGEVDRIRSYVRGTLVEVHHQNPPNPYRARSFFEEAVSHGPNDESWEELTRVLLDRAGCGPGSTWGRLVPLGQTVRLSESLSPVRERMTAAAVAAQRILMPGHASRNLPALRSLAQHLIETGSAPHPRSGSRRNEEGLIFTGHWLTLKLTSDHMDDGFPYAYSEAPVSELDPSRERCASNDELWRRPGPSIVREMLSSRAFQEQLGLVRGPFRQATEHLVATACLTPNGVLRRQCLDTLRAAGLATPAGEMFRNLAHATGATGHSATEGDVRWLAEHACFCVARVGVDWESAHWLLDVAVPKVRASEQLSLDERALRLTALMGLGDAARQIRLTEDGSIAARVVDRIVSATLETDSAGFRRVPTLPEARAMVYVVGMMRAADNDASVEFLFQAAEGGMCVRDGAGSPVENYDDLVLRRLGSWALERLAFRKTAESTTRNHSELVATVGSDADRAERRDDALQVLVEDLVPASPDT